MTDQPADDPRRHIRVRLVAAQILVNTVLPAPSEPPAVFDAAADLARAIGVTDRELLSEIVCLIGKHADTREVMARTLQSEIAELTLFLENV